MSLTEEQPVTADAHVTSAWERVQLARQAGRPHTLDYVQLIFDEFAELHGDRLFADDPAIVAGPASLDGRTVFLVGHQKGGDTKENAARRFGMPRPEGYRKALRIMLQAEKFGFPVLSLIDTPGADPTLVSEERGQALAIARNLLRMARLAVPTVAAVIGEGGSGGAIAIGLSDRVLMQENSVYSVVSPEGCASILWRDATLAPQAAAAMKITAPDLLAFGIIDDVVAEPPGGAQSDPVTAAALLKTAFQKSLDELDRKYGRGASLNVGRMLADRFERYRRIGVFAEVGPRSSNSANERP